MALALMRASRVLIPGPARDDLVEAVNLAGARFTARRNALGLAAVYENALRAPAREKLVTDIPLVKDQLRSTKTELAALRKVVEDPLNRGLVGPDAVLPPDLRRAVLAVAGRPALLKTAQFAYRAGYLLRHPLRGLRKGIGK